MLKSTYDVQPPKNRLDLVCEDIIPSFRSMLERTGKASSNTIVDFILAANVECNLSVNSKKSYLSVLSKLSLFHKNNLFKNLKREDLIEFLNSFRKPEPLDPMHKWIGTYNLYLVLLSRFLKWLYHPDLHQKERPIPECLENLPNLKRREKSIYKPTDLWTVEDDLLFLKYCQFKRDKCYHAISRDSSCRPHELLNLKIKDVVFKMMRDKQYSEILVNGKTGSRHIPLINSIPYLKDWLDDHPAKNNHNSALICNTGKILGRKITIGAISMMYQRNKRHFQSLLDNPTISPEDKPYIRQLLKKPWNPYIRRHSALTDKSKILKEHVLRQHAGWSVGSNMPQVYLHYFGNESSESLLEAYGLKPKTEELDKMKPKQCPNCMEPNKPDSKFCAKCRMVLSYDAYTETVEQNEKQTDKLAIMEVRQEKFELIIQSLIDSGQLKPGHT